MASRKQTSVKALRERQNLIQKYEIAFDGPIAPRHWPLTYVPTFQKIREIENIQYERFVEVLANEEYEAIDSLVPMPERVANLIRVAYDMRNSLANEATWRSRTENLVLDRFHTDMPCDHCHKRRWVSKFYLDPLYPLAAEKLQIKRARTMLCRCRHVDRMRDQSPKKLQNPFLYRGHEPVIDDSVPEYKTKALRAQRPDYVIGLRQTAKLRSLLSNKPDIVDTPFEKSSSPSFPFLLVEAKPEYGCPGFTSVEEQSAFPLRTLLNIQKNVPTTAEARFDPLVWFLANQGDEWRIYACVPDGIRTRIIDLWHGSILREDSALQLLLIVDMICDWARDIYRKEIMKCLASAEFGSRGFTPADSRISYNPLSGGETSPIQSDGHSSTGDSDLTTSRIDNDSAGNSIELGIPDHFVDNEDENAMIVAEADPSSKGALMPSTTSEAGIGSFDTLLVSDVEMVDSGHEDVSETTSTGAETQNAVIRHANDVIFLFHTLALPEAQTDLMRLLTSPSTISDIAQAAGKLVMLFCGRNQTLTRRSTIRYLESWWTGAKSAREPYNSDVDDDIVIAHFSFESYFRQHDWELVRKLTCIMASSNTIETLARISSIGRPVINNYRGEHICTRNNFLNVTRYLRDLCCENSAKGGISNIHLYLCQDYASFEMGRPQYEWRKSTLQIRDILGTLQQAEKLIKVSALERRGQVKYSIMQNMPLNLEFGLQTQNIGAFLAKKPDSWPDSCPKYSLVVFDKSNIKDNHLMASKISDAIWHQAFFHETGSSMSQEDVSAFTVWMKQLRGELPSPD